jgi:hypothetical protein
MNFISYLLLIILSVFNTGGMIPVSKKNKPAADAAIYQVSKLKSPIKIDGDWNKAQWKKIKPIDVALYMGAVSPFKPQIQAKMAYDDNNVYVIFRVQDRFVKSNLTKINDQVSTNSCVEFFFAPDSEYPLRYFNLEINAGGTPLMYYITKPMSELTILKDEEISQIEIGHSLPSVVDPEITEPVTWTLEYRIPLSMLKTYSNVTKPAPGVIWKANFYKTGSRTSNKNYLTWSFVDNPTPNFHLPQFFGTLKFQ